MALNQIFKGQPGGYGILGPTSLNIPGLTPIGRTLPNDGGTYPTVTTAQPTAPTTPATPDITPVTKPLFSNSTSGQTNTAPATPNIPSSWLDPKTGGVLAPNDIVNNAASAISRPAVNGDVPAYAGNQLTNGPQTTGQLQTSAAELNNARNDIATGTTDPYRVGNESGIAYSPAELNAIQKAYAGIYDPAINGALAKLDLKQKQDAANIQLERDKSLAATKFGYDKALKAIPTYVQSIQYGPETGGNGGGVFTASQQNKGAENAGLNGMTDPQWKTLPAGVKNFYIQQPKSKTVDPITGEKPTLQSILDKDVQDVIAGNISYEDFKNAINDPATTLPPEVKDYYLSLVSAPGPLTPDVLNAAGLNSYPQQ